MDVRFNGRNETWSVKYFDGDRTWAIEVPPVDVVEALTYIINTAIEIRGVLLGSEGDSIAFVSEAGQEYRIECTD
jgi:hypothetical protein